MRKRDLRLRRADKPVAIVAVLVALVSAAGSVGHAASGPGVSAAAHQAKAKLKLKDGNFGGKSDQGKHVFFALRSHGTRVASFVASVKILCHDKFGQDQPFYANGGNTPFSPGGRMAVTGRTFHGQVRQSYGSAVDVLKIHGKFTDADHAVGGISYSSDDATHHCPEVSASWHVKRS